MKHVRQPIKNPIPIITLDEQILAFSVGSHFKYSDRNQCFMQQPNSIFPEKDPAGKPG